MKNMFKNLWMFFEKNSVLETDSPSERRRKVTLVMLTVLCCLSGVLVVTRNLIISRPFIEILMPGTFVMIVGIAFVVYLYTKQFAYLLYPFLTMISYNN